MGLTLNYVQTVQNKKYRGNCDGVICIVYTLDENLNGNYTCSMSIFSHIWALCVTITMTIAIRICPFKCSESVFKGRMKLNKNEAKEESSKNVTSWNCSCVYYACSSLTLSHLFDCLPLCFNQSVTQAWHYLLSNCVLWLFV